ncbi:MAG: acyl carrier protein [Candidatus Sericytochromatia bacterium]
MNQTEIRAKILQVLAGIAPEAATGSINEGVDFRDQFDFDSMDFLNFAIALSKAFAIDLPEREYPRLANLKGCQDYLAKAIVS